MQKIMIIEDDQTIVRALFSAFQHHEFDVRSAGDFETGMPLLEQDPPDLVVLDVMLPGLDGFGACKKIREKYPDLPVIMLTAKSQESDKLLGFELGADDYVTKPFSAGELVARIKAVLKRSTRHPEPRGNSQDHSQRDSRISIGTAVVDFDTFTVCRDDRESGLSPKEHGILKLLVRNPGRVISRSRIIDKVWGDDYFPSPKTVDNFVVKLRNKIEENPRQPRHILTVHGVGYKFKF